MQASLTQDGNAVLLRLPSGIGWRLRMQGAVLSLAESVYLGAGSVQKTRQVVLDGHVGSTGATVKWAIRREARKATENRRAGAVGRALSSSSTYNSIFLELSLTSSYRRVISPLMETSQAIAALGALAQETRLAIFRLLVERGPEGLAAGAIAERLRFPPRHCRFTSRSLAMPGWWRRGARAGR